MAITQTTNLLRVEIEYPTKTYPTITIHEDIYFDDPNDDILPVSTRNRRRINVIEGNSPLLPDLSGEHQIVQDIANAIWTSP